METGDVHLRLLPPAVRTADFPSLCTSSISFVAF